MSEFEWTNAQTMAAVAYIEQERWQMYVEMLEGESSYGGKHIPLIQNMCRPKFNEKTIAHIDWQQVASALFVEYVVWLEVNQKEVQK